MRIQRRVAGLNNSQKIRVIVDGVGLYTTVGDTDKICTTKHRAAVHVALMNLVDDRRKFGKQRVGFGFNYDFRGQTVSVQVDLINE